MPAASLRNKSPFHHVLTTSGFDLPAQVPKPRANLVLYAGVLSTASQRATGEH
jgi:hypothetical protein